MHESAKTSFFVRKTIAKARMWRNLKGHGVVCVLGPTIQVTIFLAIQLGRQFQNIVKTNLAYIKFSSVSVSPMELSVKDCVEIQEEYTLGCLPSLPGPPAVLLLSFCPQQPPDIESTFNRFPRRSAKTGWCFVFRLPRCLVLSFFLFYALSVFSLLPSIRVSI